jgi:bacteriorhodopsin
MVNADNTVINSSSRVILLVKKESLKLSIIFHLLCSIVWIYPTVTIIKDALVAAITPVG